VTDGDPAGYIRDAVPPLDLRLHAAEPWEPLIAAALRAHEPPTRALEPLEYLDTGSKAVLFDCEDGPFYVKGAQSGRGVIADQIVGKLGAALGAPVATVRLVHVSPELVQRHHDLCFFRPGVSHGSMKIPNLSDGLDIRETHRSENRSRFARLAVLYGLCVPADRQYMYENVPASLVHSVDHGLFFPRRDQWCACDLDESLEVALDEEFMAACEFTEDEVQAAMTALQGVGESEIAAAVAAPHEGWGLTMTDRAELARFLGRRRDKMLVKYLTP